MTRMQPTGTGVWSSALRYGDHHAAGDAAAELEVLGYRAAWLPDVGGDLFEAVEAVLAGTRSLTVATGILNIWFHEPAVATERYHALTAAHGERLLYGLGVSHGPLIDGSGGPGTYQRPLAKMTAYLDGLDAEAEPVPVAARVLAALGPKMIALAGARTAGTHPYLGTPELTHRSREALGSGAYLAPEQAVVLDAHPDQARTVAREHLAMYLALPNYRNSLRRLGFAEADFADGGSNALVDRLVVWGTEDAIAARVAEHRAAGADHVCLQVLGGPLTEPPLDAWRRLAPAVV